jgi:hypothetical protein
VNPKSQSPSPEDARRIRASLRMALWPLLMYGIALVWAYLSRPFDGLNTSSQNVVYGLLVGLPFWALILVFVACTRRDLRSGPKKNAD